jgi:hypothetical protein
MAAVGVAYKTKNIMNVQTLLSDWNFMRFMWIRRLHGYTGFETQSSLWSSSCFPASGRYKYWLLCSEWLRHTKKKIAIILKT